MAGEGREGTHLKEKKELVCSSRQSPECRYAPPPPDQFQATSMMPLLAELGKGAQILCRDKLTWAQHAKGEGVNLGTLPSRMRPIPWGRAPGQICRSTRPSSGWFRRRELKTQGSIMKEFLSEIIKSLLNLIA